MTTTVHFFRAAFPPHGHVGAITTPSPRPLDAAFAAFNRGSGSEVRFSGPSASVGDLFALDSGEVYRVASLGFTTADMKFDAATRSLSETTDDGVEANEIRKRARIAERNEY